MTRQSTVFGAGGGGLFTSDPRELPRFMTSADGLSVYDNDALYLSNSPNFHVSIVGKGATLVMPTTADTYGTITDVSGGPGFMANAYGPMSATPGEVTFRITVDGVATVITGYQSTTSVRMCLGGFAENSKTGDLLEQSEKINWAAVNGDPRINDITDFAVVNILPPAYAALGANKYTCLAWKDSFKLEVKHENLLTASNTGTTVGATYQLL